MGMPTLNSQTSRLQQAVMAVPGRAAQFPHAAFHDVGTFDQTMLECGANGCLLNDSFMLVPNENLGLDDPVFILQVSDFILNEDFSRNDVIFCVFTMIFAPH